MRVDKIIKRIGLNLAIAMANIVIFSNGFLGVHIGANAFQTALGITSILMSFIFFVYGNYSLSVEKTVPVHITELRTPEDCILALKQSNVKRTFYLDINTILEQTNRFAMKKETIRDILLQKFSSGEMSFSKFNGAIDDVENVFYMNIKSVINKLNAFDELDYNRVRSISYQKKLSQEVMETKMGIYNDYIAFVKESIDDNEQILLKLDRLLFEISKFSSLEEGELETLSAMKEIDQLIDQTKFYK